MLRGCRIFIESFINLISLSISRFSFTDQFGAWLLPVLCLLFSLLCHSVFKRSHYVVFSPLLYCFLLGDRLPHAAEITLSPLVCQQQEWTENISVRCYKMQSVSGSHQLHDTPSKNLMQEPRLPIFLYNFKYNPKDKFIASEKQAEGSSWWRETVNASYFHYHAHCALAFGGILKHGFLGFYCLYVLAQCYFSVYFNEWIYYIAHCKKFSVTLLKTL